MSTTFKVNERAIYAPDNIELTIIGRLKLCQNKEDGSWFGYPTDYKLEDGGQLCPRPHDLRKKPGGVDGLYVSDSTKLDSSNKVGQPAIKQPERATS